MREPQTLTLARRTLDLKEYRARSAQESDYATLIDAPTIIRDAEDDRVSIVYLELDDDCTDVITVLQRIRYEENFRTGGLKTRSRLFGYKPRNVIRSDFCTATSLAGEDPSGHAVVTGYAQRVAQWYRQYNPDLYDAHATQVEKVLPEWRIDESVFTSGIINKNNPLAYHFDAGNFKRVWSNMLVFKHQVEGGYLAVPEYDAGFYLRNNSLLMFDGQNLLHGVTPITLNRTDAFRYSIVYYSLQQMWNCAPFGEEVQRARSLRVQREQARAGRDAAKIPLDPDDPKTFQPQTLLEAPIEGE